MFTFNPTEASWIRLIWVLILMCKCKQVEDILIVISFFIIHFYKC